MSTGKYGMKMQVPATNQQFVLNSNDPWYNLGGLLGMMWGNNYNQRGIDKGIKEAQNALDGINGTPPVPSLQVPDSLYTQGKDLGLVGNDGKLTGQAMDGWQMYDPKASTLTPAKTSNAKAGDGQQASTVNPKDQVTYEKWGFLKDKYGGATPNPDGDAKVINSTTNAIQNNLLNTDLSKFPFAKASDYQSALEAELRKNGRTDYQIEQIMKTMNPKIASKVDETNNAAWDKLYDLYKQQVQSGMIDASSITYGEMAKRNPERTKALINQYNRNQSDFKSEYEINQKIKQYMKAYPDLTEQEARAAVVGGNIYSPKQLQAMGYVSNGRGGYSLPRTSSGSGGRPRGTSSGTKAEKQAAWKDRVAWANNILGNPNATPEMKQSATAVLEAYDRAMAGDQYVVPYANVQRYLENAIGSGLLTPEQAYDWAFDDSGLGDDEARKLGKWVQENYLSNDNISENARDEFFSLGNNNNNASAEPEEKPNSEGHTGIVASLDDLAKRFHDFKLSDVAGWVKTH